MRNKEDYYRDVLLYDVLDKSDFIFSNKKLLKDNIEHIKFYKSGKSLIEHFKKKFDSKRVDNKDFHINKQNQQHYLYLLYADSLLWVFLGNIDNADKTAATIEKYFSKSVQSIKVTDKEFMESLLINKFSDNLLEITSVQDGYYDFIDSTNIYGSQVNYSSEYEQLINDNSNIISYSLQPMNETNVITFRDENNIEFSKHMKLSEIIRVIDKLSNYYIKYIKRS